MKREWWYAAAAGMVLLGCGGSDSVSTATTAPVVTGTFVDAPVEGIGFSCVTGANQSTAGVTDANGTFQYPQGAICTFTIGQLVLGSVTVGSSGRVTPYDLSDSNETVANIASLLQTLDQNRSDSYLTIPLQARSDMNGTAINLKLPSADFTAAIQAIATAYNTTVVTPTEAKAVMDTYLASLSNTNGDNSGSSVLTCDTSKFASGATVATPGSMDWLSFAGTYVASEGSLDANMNFVASKQVMVSLSTAGELFYTGSTPTPLTSACVETLSGGNKQLVLHTAKGHLDFGSDKTTISGISPVDGTTIVKTYTAPSGGGDVGGGVDTPIDYSKYDIITLYINMSSESAAGMKKTTDSTGSAVTSYVDSATTCENLGYTLYKDYGTYNGITTSAYQDGSGRICNQTDYKESSTLSGNTALLVAITN